MTIDDLQHIFKPQLQSGGSSKLFWLIQEGGTKIIERGDPDHLDDIAVGLSAFTYNGTIAGMPRFVK
jgi:hypothetical protein